MNDQSMTIAARIRVQIPSWNTRRWAIGPGLRAKGHRHHRLFRVTPQDGSIDRSSPRWPANLDRDLDGGWTDRLTAGKYRAKCFRVDPVPNAPGNTLRTSPTISTCSRTGSIANLSPRYRNVFGFSR